MIQEDELREIEELKASLLGQAKQAALKKLDRRERSSGEIRVFLKSLGFSPETISQTIEELQARNYLNDERYSRALIRELGRGGKGPTWIQMKLRQKGIQLDRAEIENLLLEVADTSELDAARKLFARKFPHELKDFSEKRKAFQILLRRGFSYEVAQKVIKKS